MPKLILIKHSLPDINPNQPASQWGLSAEGRRRSLALAHRLAAYYPAKVISSPERAALETAQRVAQKLGLAVHVNERLHAHRRAKTGFLPPDQFKNAIENFFDRPEERVFGEETATEAQVRFSNVIWRCVEQYPSQNLAVVAHGAVISLFAASCCKVEPFELWQRLGMPSFVVLRLPDLTVEDVVERITESGVRQVA